MEFILIFIFILAFGWRLKPLHRLMLLSSTYQQASDMRGGDEGRSAG